MKTKFWLKVDKNGGTKTSKGQPRMRPGEVAIQLSVSLPDKVFRQPNFSADITVSEESIVTPVVDVEVTAPEQVLALAAREADHD